MNFSTLTAAATCSAMLRYARRAGLRCVRASRPCVLVFGRARAFAASASFMAADDKEHDLQLSELTAISSIDGRYASRAKRLRNYFSEYAIIKYRVKAEVQWLLALSANPQISEVPEFTKDERAGILALVSEFDETAARRVKEIERTTNHDVKAVEYYIKEKMESLGERTSKISEFVHFACTSEDITNLAYAQALGRSRESVMLPAMDGLIGTLKGLAHEHAGLPMLCRTHGQPATPSTLGKEVANFAYRMQKHRDSYAAVAVLGKMNGAVGNFNAHEVAYPEVDWETFAAGVMSEGLGVEQNPYTTQIETHDYKAEMFDSLTRFNDVLLDFNRDMWSYISLGYFKQIAVKGEVGSSTMPHKVNPIDFENSEGNLGVATAMFQHMARKLAVSRYQRDLSDSTVLRTIGTGFAHTIVAIASTQKGLTRVQPNVDKLAADLDDNWEVLGEPVQTVMRRYSVSEPYEKLKALTRGKKVDAAKMREFVEGLRGQEMPDSAIDSMLELTPGTYTGKAEELAKRV